MSRHLYDLEKLMHTQYANDALHDMPLYQQIIAHRKRFYHVGGVDYEKDMPQYIDFIPQGELATRFSVDYTDMLNTYIYEKDTALQYDVLIDRLTELKKSFRTLTK